MDLFDTFHDSIIKDIKLDWSKCTIDIEFVLCKDNRTLRSIFFADFK